MILRRVGVVLLAMLWLAWAGTCSWMVVNDESDRQRWEGVE